MKAVSDRLQVLRMETDGFRAVGASHFDCEDNACLLLAGKGLTTLDCPADNFRAWEACARMFSHAEAASGIVTSQLRSASEMIVDRVMSETKHMREVTVDWIVENPFSFPVFINATGTCSKKKYKKDLSLSGASDRRIGPKDAERIVRALKPDNVLSKGEIVAGMQGLIEGIVRDQIGKVVNEDFVRLALDSLDLSYVRDEGGTQLVKGRYSASRTDFAMPCNENPKVFIDVRKSATNHASHYASDLSNSVADRITAHPECLAILVYDGEWTAPALERVQLAYDHVFSVVDSGDAAAVAERHVKGEDMRKPEGQRIYYTSSAPASVEVIEALRDLVAACGVQTDGLGPTVAAAMAKAKAALRIDEATSIA